VMKEMFEASVDGQAFDMERWGQYFRPAGVQAPAGAAKEAVAEAEPAAPVAVAKPAATTSSFDDEDDAPAAAQPVAAAKPAQKAEDILAMIRARQAKQ